MKQIIKNAEPNSLVQHRTQTHASFDNIPSETKEELRQSLLSEQGYICCYCMKRIPEKVTNNGVVSYEMKIEHFQSQTEFPNLLLSYTNLLGACKGNDGKPKKLQTCDTKKGNDVLMINLLANNPSCETLFKYNSDGEISSASNDSEINRQLNEVLNLNMQSLKDARREIYLEVQERIRLKSKKDKASFVKLLEQEKTRWLERTDNKYKPFCSVAVYYLTKKIKSTQK